MRKIIVPLFVGVLFLSVVRSEAANHYIRAGAAGTGTGNNWTDAWPSLPASFVRGDTYYVADGNYGSLTLSTPVSGTTYITIKKATPADHGIDTGWDNTYGDGAASLTGTLSVATSYWVIDGQIRSSWTNGYGFALTGPSGGGPGLLIGDGVRYVTVKYMSLTGHAATAAWSGGPSGDNAIWLNGVSSNITISHCYAYSWGCCMVKTYTGSIESSVFEYSRFEWNRSSAAYHAEGVFPWGMNNSIWRNNVWVDIEGTGIIMLGNGGNNEIYGNIVYWSSAYPHTGQDGAYIGNGIFTTWTAYTTVNNKFYNNTIIVPNSGGIEFGISYPNTTSSGTARNNLYYCAGGNRNVYSSSVSSDYDIFYGLTHTTQANGVNGTGNPFVDAANYDFRLKAHIAAGVNLGAPYDVDMNDNVRSTWDRGALEYSTGSTSSTNPSVQLTPTSLDFGVVYVGTTNNLTFSLRNSGGGTLSGSATATAPFQVVAGSTYSLGSNQSQTITVRYVPQAAAVHGSSVTLSGNVSATLAVSGQAVTQPAPSAANFEAENGTVTAPFTIANGSVSQSVTTAMTGGGRASYLFNVASNGVYTLTALVNAPSLVENSFYVNIDTEPTDPYTIWDIPVTSGFETRSLSWRGNGLADSYTINPKTFYLTQGSHNLILIGREANCLIDKIQIVAAPGPLPPSGLTVISN